MPEVTTARGERQSAERCPGRQGVWLVVAALVLTLVMHVALAAQTFRGRLDLVQVTVTVTDRDGRLVTGLERDDFQVWEDGAEQRVLQFTDERTPVSIGMLVDASDSMRGEGIVHARGAVDRFVGELLFPEDEAFAATFNHAPHLASMWKRPPPVLQKVLDRVRPSGGTAIYDALVAFTPMFSRRTHSRAALVVVSDGADTASDRTLQQARDIVRRSDAFVYAIAIDSMDARASTRVSADALRDITGPTGGYTEVVRSSADIGPATERIANELNQQYVLGYSSSRPPDGTWRSIRIQMRDASYLARSRRGYTAQPARD